MARVKIDLVCVCCGEKFTHIHFCNNSKSAYSYEEWAKENITVCHECYSKNKKAEEKRNQEEVQKKFNLVELSGSVKQISWANDIRRKAIAVVMGGINPNEKFTNAVNSKTEAKWWIENRNSFDTVNEVVRTLIK